MTPTPPQAGERAEALLPCPFCGRHGKVVQQSRKSWSVNCMGCCVETAFKSSPSSARDTWNARADAADARRYRWLRLHQTDRFARNNENEPCLLLPFNADYLSPDETDAAIDAAISALDSEESK